jgi:DNA-binding transcriptional LysR family regulator
VSQSRPPRSHIISENRGISTASLEGAVRDDAMVAIFHAAAEDIPQVVTPASRKGRPLILKYHHVNQHRLSRGWLQAGGVDVRPALQSDGIEAIKYAVAAGLGVAIVPSSALNCGPALNSIIARPLDPPLTRTLGLIQRREKYDDPALRVVREAILTAAKVKDEPPRHRVRHRV